MHPRDLQLIPTADLAPLPSAAVIAIDGPAGSGKSTTARHLAHRFGLLYIDTGAMYRALTLAALRAGTDLQSDPSLTALLEEARLELVPGKSETAVRWNGQDVSDAIRTPEVEAAVSLVSSHAGVRADMVRRQQEFGRRGGVVMEGRDIGSVVFPLATAKIFLSASLEARVGRRLRQFKQRGKELSPERIRADLQARDELDSEREVSPLTVSPDAVVVDSSSMNLQEQNDACARACRYNPTLNRSLDRDLERARVRLPWHYRLAFTVMETLGRFYGLRQVGNEGCALPRGCIVAVNHISLWDPPLVGGTLHQYRVNTLAKAELFRPAPMGSFFRWLDSIPIRRRGFDQEAFQIATNFLHAGNNLLIFPEGTRRPVGTPGPVRSGLGILVQNSLAPMQPIFIRGSYGRQPMGSTLSPLEVSYGPVVWWHGVAELQRRLEPREVSRRIANLCEAVFFELQAQSFARIPQTDFEKELGENQIEHLERRSHEVFGRS